MAKMYPGMNSSEQETSVTKEEGVLPKTKMPTLDKAGIKNSGYLTKKGEPSGLDARFNDLPPGMNIEDQKNSDIRSQEMITYSGGISYPGDGWT
jgi:hypothetical protein